MRSPSVDDVELDEEGEEGTSRMALKMFSLRPGIEEEGLASRFWMVSKVEAWFWVQRERYS